MSKSGLLVFVYRNGEDCTNGGITSKQDQIILVLPEGGPFKVRDGEPYLVLNPREEMSRALGHDCTVAEPGFDHRMTEEYWNMFGGNFIYSSDSRFPKNHPIPVHDRFDKYV